MSERILLASEKEQNAERVGPADGRRVEKNAIFDERTIERWNSPVWPI